MTTAEAILMIAFVAFAVLWSLATAFGFIYSWRKTGADQEAFKRAAEKLIQKHYLKMQFDMRRLIAAATKPAPELAAATAPEEPEETFEEIWNDPKKLDEWAKRLNENEEVPNLPEFQHLMPNELYHQIQDRLDELNEK